MRRRITAGLVALVILLFCGSALALPTADDLIEVAFVMLEKDNPFIPRFEARSGRTVEVLFEQGMPYMFGGKHSAGMTNQWPDYQPRLCREESDYFKLGNYYLFGMDCTGYTNYINKFAHRRLHDTLTKMMLNREYEANRIYEHAEGKEMPPWTELKDHLEVGDFLLLHSSGARYRHILMYIGTMRDFGYTEEDEPALAKYLDYPLVIHCGMSPVYGERMQQVIDAKPELYRKCTTTDGGVMISIVGVDPEDAPVHRTVQGTDFDYFVMNDKEYVLTVIRMRDEYCWFRLYV